MFDLNQKTIEFSFEVITESLAFIEAQFKSKNAEFNFAFEKHLQTNIEKMLGTESKCVIAFMKKNMEHRLEKIRALSYTVFSNFSYIYLQYQYTEFTTKGIKEMPSIHSEILKFLDSLKPVQIQKIEACGANYTANYKQLLDDARKVNAELAKTSLTIAEPLSEESKLKWSAHLEYYSNDIIECIASSNWVNRSRAISKFKEEAENIIEVKDPQKLNINKSKVSLKDGSTHISFFFVEALKEPVMKNYIDALELLREIIVLYSRVPLEAELKTMLISIFPLIISKLGDLKDKIKEMSLQIISHFASQQYIGPEFTINQLLEFIASKDMKGKSEMRTAGGLLQSMIQLQNTFSVSKISESILNAMMQFIKLILEYGLAAQKALANSLTSVLKTTHEAIADQMDEISPHKAKKEKVIMKATFINDEAEALLKSENKKYQIEGISEAKKCLIEKIKVSVMDEIMALEIIKESLSIVMYFITADETQGVMESLKLLEFSLAQCLPKASALPIHECINLILNSLVIDTINKNIRIQIQSDKFILKLISIESITPSMLSSMILKMVDQYVLPEGVSSMNASYSKFPTTDADKNSFAMANKILGLLKQMILQCSAHLSTRKDFISQLLDTTATLYKLHSAKPSFKQLLVELCRPLYEVDNTYIEQYMGGCDFTKRLLLKELILQTKKDDSDNVMMDPKTMQHTKDTPVKQSEKIKDIKEDAKFTKEDRKVFSNTMGDIGIARKSSVDNIPLSRDGSEYKKLPSLEKRNLKKKISASSIQKQPTDDSKPQLPNIHSMLPALPKPVQFVVPKSMEKKIVASSVGFDKEKAHKKMEFSEKLFNDDALEKEMKLKFN